MSFCLLLSSLLSDSLRCNSRQCGVFDGRCVSCHWWSCCKLSVYGNCGVYLDVCANEEQDQKWYCRSPCQEEHEPQGNTIRQTLPSIGKSWYESWRSIDDHFRDTFWQLGHFVTFVNKRNTFTHFWPLLSETIPEWLKRRKDYIIEGLNENCSNFTWGWKCSIPTRPFFKILTTLSFWSLLTKKTL